MKNRMILVLGLIACFDAYGSAVVGAKPGITYKEVKARHLEILEAGIPVARSGAYSKPVQEALEKYNEVIEKSRSGASYVRESVTPAQAWACLDLLEVAIGRRKK